MKLSKIGSKNTYHKCIKELHEAKYIYYQPTSSKFLPVRISLIRLDIQEEQPDRYKQLDLFGTSENESQNSKQNTPTKPSPPLSEATEQKSEGWERSSLGGGLSEGPCPNIGTDGVPILTATCTDFDTVPVPKMGHNIKHKHFIKESKPPSQKIFDKNEKLSDEINRLAGVPNSVHGCHPERSEGPPQIKEVEEFFKSTNYPDTEAKKFFNHYKAIGWKIKGITPIEDWQAAAHKWMLNAGKFEPVKSNKDFPPAKDLQYLYERFLEGQQVFKFILPEHFTELNLELTEETMQDAWVERINQLTGTNQHSLNQLWDAYLGRQ